MTNEEALEVLSKEKEALNSQEGDIPELDKSVCYDLNRTFAEGDSSEGSDLLNDNFFNEEGGHARDTEAHPADPSDNKSCQ